MEEESFPEKLFSRTCRTCMCKEASEDSQVLQSIFVSPKEDGTVRIVDLLISATPQLAIEPTDQLPKEICAHCLSRVLSVHQFQQMCLRSDAHMRNLLDYNAVEDKFTEAPEELELQTEDPLQSAIADSTPLLNYDGELKTCLKLELREEDEEEQNCAINEDIVNDTNNRLENAEIDDIVDDTDNRLENAQTEENKTTAEITVNNMDTASNCGSTDLKSDLDTDSDWEEKNGKTKLKKGKIKKESAARYSKLDDTDNILEQPNPKNRRTASLPCPDCGKIFDRTYSLNRHMNVHKALGKPHECIKCKYRFSTKAHLKRHELIHETEMQNVFTSSDAPNNPEGYKCIDCPRRFAKRESLSAHRQSHSKLVDGSEESQKVYACNLCPKQFKKLNQLTRHSRIHAENKHFKCHLCDKAFGLNAHLVDHLNKHNGVKPYVCNFCSKAFQQSCTLKDHIRTHTGEQPYLCSECGKAFNSSSNMKQHLLRHTGEKRYECPECPKKFPCLSDLGSHMAVHNKVKPHVCDICGAAFGKPYQLKKHKMYHNGEKPHKCEYCEMRFVCADHMRRHMRTHTGEKPYKCKYCERAFAQSNDLVKHLRSHVGENVYKCELCPKAFRLATELREHFAQHKNDDEATRAKNALALDNEDIMRPSIGVVESAENVHPANAPLDEIV